MFGSWRRQRARQELDRVSSTIHCSPLEEALSELDAIDTRTLSPYEVALWLNNRAYVLALLGSTVEALDSLGDAEALLVGDEEAEPVPVDSLRACIIGTRGIAYLHAGELDQAEAHLQDAFDRGAPSLSNENAGMLWVEQSLAAERLWWLALIAHKRGDDVRRTELLRRASTFGTTFYGEKAEQALVEGTAP